MNKNIGLRTGALALAASIAFAITSSIGAPTLLLPPCQTEDATYNCYWDADTMGNGQGQDFVVIDGQVLTP